MLLGSLIVSLVVWLLVYWIVKPTSSKPKASDALTVLIGLFVFGLAVSSMMAVLAGALVFGMGMICRKRGITGWRFAAATFAMVPLAGLIISLFAWQHVHKLATLQAKYPFVPIADRLGYEASAIHSIQLAGPDRPTEKLDFDSVMLLRAMDEQAEMWGDWRHRLLGELHQSQLEAFINSPGFGPLRGLPSVSESYLQGDPRPTITPPAPPEIPYVPDNAARQVDGTKGELATGASEEGEILAPQDPSRDLFPLKKDHLKSLHRASAVDFINTQGFGWVESGRMTGFEPHSFSKLPELDGSNKDGWILISLQLVRLLKHETPVVYATKELPRMEVLRSEDIPTRPLDAFEAKALPKIKQGEMVIVEESTNRIRMLGAVHAGNSCVECHAVPADTLLGAFSYELARTNPLPEAKAAVVKPDL